MFYGPLSMVSRLARLVLDFSCVGEKRFVYILRSDADPNRHYVGLTSNVGRRLHWHNTGPSGVTVRNKPWSLVVAVEFADTGAAWRFGAVSDVGLGPGLRQAALRLENPATPVLHRRARAS